MIFRDFKELLFEFNAHEVKYLIVRGYAVSISMKRGRAVSVSRWTKL
jgi:hypothetical protein